MPTPAEKLEQLYRDLYREQLNWRDQLSSIIAVPLTAMAFIATALTFLVGDVVHSHYAPVISLPLYVLLFFVAVLLIVAGRFLIKGETKGDYGYPSANSEDYLTMLDDRRMAADEIGTTYDEQKEFSKILMQTYAQGYRQALESNETRNRLRTKAFVPVVFAISVLMICFMLLLANSYFSWSANGPGIDLSIKDQILRLLEKCPCSLD